MKKLKKILIAVCTLIIINRADSQTITVSSSTPTCYSRTFCPVNVTLSEVPVYGSVKLKLKFLNDSSSSYYANSETITYILGIVQARTSYALSITPNDIGTASITNGTPAPAINSVAATINGLSNFYDSSKALRKGKYELTAEYARTSTGAIISSASIFKWNLQPFTLPPKILSPSTGTVTKGTFLFKDKIYDSAVSASSKKIAIYKSSDRSLLSTLTLGNALTDSFNINLNSLATDGSNITNISGLSALTADTYKLVLSYQDSVGHPAASDSTILTLRTSTTAPVLYTAKNTVFNYLNPNGPISYMLPDSASTASLAFRNITDGSYNVTVTLPTISKTQQYYSIPTNLAFTNGKYQIVVSYIDYLGNPAASVTDTVFFQKTTPVPVITSPTNWQTLTSPVIIKDSIPGTILAGSKQLTISGVSKSGVSNSLTFTLGNAQKDSVYYDCVTDPFLNGTVVSTSGTTALPDGNYVISLSYRDQYGNPTVTSTPVNFTLKRNTTIPVLLSPAAYSNNGNVLSINYSLPDTSRLANSTVLVFTNGTQTDSLFLNPQNTTGSQSFTWATNTDPTTITGTPVAYSHPALPNGIPNGIYTVSLSYKDNLGNPVASVTNTQVTINAKPVITASGPLIFCYGDSVRLTSSAPYGNKWFLNDNATAIDTAAMITVKNAGLYRLVSGFDNLTLGGYDLRNTSAVSVSVKQIPGTPGTQNISYYVQDTITTALIADVAIGNTLRWYGTNGTGDAVLTTAPIPKTSVAGTFNYYVSQLNTTSGCESPRAAIVVSIVALPPGINKNGKVGGKDVLQSSGKKIEIIK